MQDEAQVTQKKEKEKEEKSKVCAKPRMAQHSKAGQFEVCIAKS